MTRQSRDVDAVLEATAERLIFSSFFFSSRDVCCTEPFSHYLFTSLCLLSFNDDDDDNNNVVPEHCPSSSNRWTGHGHPTCGGSTVGERKHGCLPCRRRSGDRGLVKLGSGLFFHGISQPHDLARRTEACGWSPWRWLECLGLID